MLAVPDLPRNRMLALSLVQGLVLLLLWRAMTEGMWPSQTPVVNFPLWTFTIAWPLLLLLSIETGNTARIFRLVSAFSAVLVLLAVYIGWQASPSGEFPVGSMVAVFIATLAVACFKALMYLQQRAAGLPLTYEVLFAFSWRNFLVTGLAAAFMGGVAGLLALWAALFRAIGIDFFEELFSKDWFLFPVLAVAFGIGVFIFRNLTRVIDSVTSLLAGLMRLLLPLVILITVLFLAALPFTGLAPLWETGRGTSLLLWLNAVTLFFINSVYQVGRQTPYPDLVHRLLCPGIALLPIISILALYGLYLRVDQYGLTVARCWGLTVAVLLGLFSCGYLWGIVRRRWSWTENLARVNIVMGWVVLALMLIVNSPLLDFRSISLASQLGRVEAGELEWREFDFDYVRRHHGRPGFLELQTLVAQLAVSDPELAERISRTLETVSMGEIETAEDFWERVTFRPQRFDVPADLQTLIERGFFRSSGKPVILRPEGADTSDPDDGRTTGEIADEDGLSIPDVDLTQYRNPVFIQVDLNDDGVLEYALVTAADGGWALGWCFYLADGVWRHQRLSLVFRSLAENAGTPNADLSDVLRHGEIETVGPAFRDLKIGGLILAPARNPW